MKLKTVTLYLIILTVLSFNTSVAASFPKAKGMEDISGRLGQWVAERLSLKASEIEVGRVRLMNGQKSFSDEQIIEVRAARPGRLLGRVLFVVTLSKNNETPFEQWVSADIQQVREILVARRTLRRLDVLQKEDLDFQSIRVRSQRVLYETDPEQVVGKRLMQSLRKGMPIRTTQLEAVPVVQRGDRVTIRFRSEGLEIVTVGVAKEDGQLGATIKVLNMDSRKLIFAEVFGAGEVRIVPHGKE